MADDVKFERGEAVLVWDASDRKSLRLFSHTQSGQVVCVGGGFEQVFLAGDNDAPKTTWDHAEKLPKPPVFRKGELVVGTGDPVGFVTFFVSEEYSLTESLRRPTINELQKWLPWCSIEAK